MRRRESTQRYPAQVQQHHDILRAKRDLRVGFGTVHRCSQAEYSLFSNSEQIAPRCKLVISAVFFTTGPACSPFVTGASSYSFDSVSESVGYGRSEPGSPAINWRSSGVGVTLAFVQYFSVFTKNEQEVQRYSTGLPKTSGGQSQNGLQPLANLR